MAYGRTIMEIFKNWALPIAMILGAAAYYLFTTFSALSPVRTAASVSIPYLLPALVFVILFFSYCKIDPKEMRPRRWQLWLILIQLIETSLCAWWCITHSDSSWLLMGEATLAIVICPMAAVGSVMTIKVGGNGATATTYTIVSSFFTAIAVPLVYPLVEPGTDITFLELFFSILLRVFPTIILPLVIAMTLRWLLPKAHALFAQLAKDYSFYMWALCCTINTAQIIRSINNSDAPAYTILTIALVTGVIVVIQFAIGRTVGQHYGDAVAAGQGLGQKNTVLSIWLALTFLNPTSAIGPGACLLWQNIINSLQIWGYNKKSRKEKM